VTRSFINSLPRRGAYPSLVSKSIESIAMVPAGRSLQTQQAYHRSEAAGISAPAPSEELSLPRLREC
jgi:hypothetical protein